MTNPIMTARDVAEFLRLSRSTMYRWRRAGVGPVSFRMNGHAIRYRQVDVDAWINTAIRRYQRFHVTGRVK